MSTKAPEGHRHRKESGFPSTFRLPSQEHHQWLSETIKENPKKTSHDTGWARGKAATAENSVQIQSISPNEKKKKSFRRKTKIITWRYCPIDPFPLNHLRSKALICNKKENEDWRPGGHSAAEEGEHEQKVSTRKVVRETETHAGSRPTVEEKEWHLCRLFLEIWVQDQG